MATRHDFEDAYSTCTSDEEDQEAEDVQEESKDCKEFIPSTCPPRGRAFLDPRSEWVQEWNRVFLLVCATGLFIDPLFFYTLSISESCMCVFVDGWFAVTVTVLRCVTDALHVWNMWLQFKMSRWWRSPHHHRGLSHDDDVARNVAARIITKAKKSFVFDLFVILPIPQSLIYFILCIKTETRSCGRGFMALQHGAQPHSPINTTIQARTSIATATGTVISIVLKA